MGARIQETLSMGKVGQHKVHAMGTMGRGLHPTPGILMPFKGGFASGAVVAPWSSSSSSEASDNGESAKEGAGMNTFKLTCS